MPEDREEKIVLSDWTNKEIFKEKGNCLSPYLSSVICIQSKQYQ